MNGLELLLRLKNLFKLILQIQGGRLFLKQLSLQEAQMALENIQQSGWQRKEQLYWSMAGKFQRHSSNSLVLLTARSEGKRIHPERRSKLKIGFTNG